MTDEDERFRNTTECERDPIAVGKEPHLYDKIGPVFFAFSILLVAIFLLDLKVIVGTVIVKDAVIPFQDGF